jgi:hypothetical protein
MHVSQTHKIVQLYQGAANAVACDVVSMKNFHKGAIVVTHTGSADTDLVLTVQEATNVAGGSAQTVANNVDIYADVDAGTSSDVLLRLTSAKTYTIDTGLAPNQVVVFEIDPDALSAGFDCVTLGDSGGNASNTVNITFIGVPRYPGYPLAAAITD